MSRRGRAIVVERPGETRIGEIETMACGDDEVLIKSLVAGVCRTDLKIAKGKMPPHTISYPCVPGHEWAGTVESTGRNVTDLKPGDRVVCEGMVYCGHCENCLNGRTNLCSNYDQLGFTRPGGYGEFVVAPRRVVHALPDHVSVAAGVLVEPASCVGYGFERLSPQAGETIGVVGVGTLGSLAILIARTFSPSAVIAYGITDEDVSQALELGADHAVNLAKEDAEAATVKALGEGPDVVLEAAGASEAVATSLGLARRGGRVVLMGSAGDGQTMNLPTDVFMRKDLTVHGSLSYTSGAWARTMSLLDSGLEVDRLITHRFPLERFDEAFQLMENRSERVVKILLEHEPPQ